MMKREVAKTKLVQSTSAVRRTGSQSLSSSSMLRSAQSIANTSGDANPKQVDPEVETDIIYSQYLHAKMMEKIMSEKKAEIETAVRDQFAELLKDESGLENPRVAYINDCTEKLKQLRQEYDKLLELKKEIDELEKN
ncbi:uncharacterized protein LOC132199407 [Neocloeon triangulifer]|uniref:uncharacterized protein LOC132199407 n=1 Tax=Neocloeon triangulifer TaxID=2078957 RepID=UPI00286F58C6|nr:uncharacterized protein LOC132199407 [Neocloeon triangulifer]